MENSIKLPIWLNALVAMYFISNLFIFGLMAMFYPNIPFPDAGETAVFPIQFFAARHIAMAFPLLYGLVKQDVKVLTVMFSIFAILSAIDVSLLVVYDYYIPILGQFPLVAKLGIALTVFLGPVLLVLYKLTTYNSIQHEKRNLSGVSV